MPGISKTRARFASWRGVSRYALLLDDPRDQHGERAGTFLQDRARSMCVSGPHSHRHARSMTAAQWARQVAHATLPLVGWNVATARHAIAASCTDHRRVVAALPARFAHAHVQPVPSDGEQRRRRSGETTDNEQKDSLCQAFWGSIWSKRKNLKKREVEPCLQHGMSQCTTPLTPVKPLRFP